MAGTHAKLGQDDPFDPATLEAMSSAFDQVRARLVSKPNLQLYKVAASILAHARAGERDPERLYKSACVDLGIDR
jgi:hypothetical protein